MVVVGPGEVIVEHASKPLVAIKASIVQSLIEASDRPLIHFLVQSVAALNPRDKCLVAVLFGVRRWSA